MEPFGEVQVVTPEQVETCAKNASDAQKYWAKTTFAQRSQLMRAFMDMILENRDEIVKLSCEDSGKTSEFFHEKNRRISKKNRN
jgi:acyl-CoA reductase-like NAD-dependent aldehyde dehydrogenase